VFSGCLKRNWDILAKKARIAEFTKRASSWLMADAQLVGKQGILSKLG
jgi:hypothetical protein